MPDWWYFDHKACRVSIAQVLFGLAVIGGLVYHVNS